VKFASLKTLIVALLLAGSAAAQIVTLSQSLNPNTITPNNTIACTAGNPPTVTSQDNGYFRSYSLAAITQPIDIVSVRFAVEQVGTTSPSGFPMLIRLYNDPNGGAPSPYASLQLRKTESFSLLPSASNTIVIQPMTGTTVTFNPGEFLVVEVFAPVGTPVGATFFLGSNAAGQTAPTYIRSQACAIPDPVTTATIGYPNMHAIIDVNYVPQGSGNPFPGTNEDLTMQTAINANALTTGVGYFVKTANAGNTATVKVVSGGTFNYRELVLIAQAYSTGSPPFPPAAPNIHMTFPGLTFLIGGDNGPLGTVLLPPGGTTVAFVVPPGLNGQSVIFQGVIVTLTAPFALNNLYAATNGHVFTIP
jgi:hypothetical protein